MYTGTADHSLTAELVSLVDVPVVASGDVTSRPRAQAVLGDDGRSGGDGRARRPGQPVGARARSSTATPGEPTREEVVAELVLFVRETVRELGERRASGFLKKFYGWYLGRGRFPKPFKQELAAARLDRRGRARLLAAAPGAVELVEELEAEIPTGDELTLELPISIYGGG